MRCLSWTVLEIQWRARQELEVHLHWYGLRLHGGMSETDDGSNGMCPINTITKNQAKGNAEAGIIMVGESEKSKQEDANEENAKRGSQGVVTHYSVCREMRSDSVYFWRLSNLHGGPRRRED